MSIDFRIERYGEVTSTSDIVRERLLAGEPEGLVVTAEVQTRGRGRLGRQWSSPAGNHYCSILLEPTPPPSQWPSLSLVVSLALAQAIGDVARLKWPNDVLIDGAKTAGVLLEAIENSVIIGTGVNIASHPENIPYAATHLHQHTPGIEHDQLLRDFLSNLELLVERWQTDGFAALKPAWQERGPAIGQQISVSAGEERYSADYRGIDDNGALLIERDSKLRTVHSGEIVTG